ncbi:hypothetical protein J3A83DRAFT_4361875 [Scleroderma citrinum]
MFQLLEAFHLLSLKLKISCYEFYNSLTHYSDNTGLNLPKAHYQQFLRIVHQWCHLKMLKQSGQGHDSTGLLNTKEGECTVLCTACPQPGKNTSISSPQRDIDALFVVLDANFHLQCCAVSNNETDLSLSQGWAYFMQDNAFKAYLSDHQDDTQKKSTCSNHNAVNLANMKVKKGCNTTGVRMVVCARHSMRLPNGIVNLQYRERYMNMDYVFASALCHSDMTLLKVSYDIACQWHKKLYQQMDKMLPLLQLNLCDQDVTFLVPIFHLPAHIASYGEEPENGLANLNPVALSMKDMGPNHHCDTLDDYFSDWNWKKLVGLGLSIHRKMKEAIPKHNDHQADFEELTKSLQVKFPQQLTLWKQQVEEWKANSTKPNPFEVKNDRIMQARIHLQLAKDKARAAMSQSELPLHPNVTPSAFISTRIDLEDQHNTLMQCLEAWQKCQVLFMPSNFPLFLPSHINDKIECPCNLQMIKFQLREGQAHDTLNDLWQGLQSHAYILKFKNQFLHDQGANTQAQNSLKVLDAKINVAATRYHMAYQALLILAPLLKQDESDEGFQEAICVKWCKACAHTHHWEEEIRLLWHTNWWTDHTNIIMSSSGISDSSML